MLRRTSFILWDEAPMAHRFLLEALHRALCDIKRNDSPFGGVVLLLAGDWRQVLPVVPRGSRGAIVQACILRSNLWQFFTVLTLDQNMRINGQSAEVQQFAEWVLELGNGSLPVSDVDKIVLPAQMCMPPNFDTAVDWAYPALQQNYSNRQWITERVILAPKNSIVDELNDKISRIFPGQETVLLSADKATNDDDAVELLMG